MEAFIEVTVRLGLCAVTIISTCCLLESTDVGLCLKSSKVNTSDIVLVEKLHDRLKEGRSRDERSTSIASDIGERQLERSKVGQGFVDNSDATGMGM